LAIGGNIIDGVECTNRHRFLRYGLGSSDREVVLAGCHLDSHQNAIQSGIEELLSIAAPAGRLAAGRGNLPFASRFRKVGDIDFGATGLTSDKSDPMSIGRELPAVIVIRCVEEGIRFVVTIEGIDLDFRLWLVRIKNTCLSGRSHSSRSHLVSSLGLASGRALPMRSEFRLGLPCRRKFARVAAQIFSGTLNSIVGDRYA
jgi:hypothetical protein